MRSSRGVAYVGLGGGNVAAGPGGGNAVARLCGSRLHAVLESSRRRF